MLEGAIVVVAVAAAAVFVARSLRRSVSPAGPAECEHADDCAVAGCCGCEAMRCEDAASASAVRIESRS